MRFFHRFTRGELCLMRTEAFNDGIFAVAVTLLVLDLKYPRDALAVSFFGCVLAFDTLLFTALLTALQAYVVGRLTMPELAPQQEPHALRKAFVGPLSHLVDAAARVYTPPTPLFCIMPPQPRVPPARNESRMLGR